MITVHLNISFVEFHFYGIETHTQWDNDRYHFSMYLLIGAYTLVPIIMYMYYMY